MTKTAGKIVSWTELRFSPANSNYAARAVIAHHFAQVPHCAFARDDGISPYLSSETGMGAFPGAPDITSPADIDIPAIQTEALAINGSLRRRLMRDGFALSVFLHAALVVALGIATLATPEQPPQEQGILSATLVTQGDVEARIAGAEEEVTKPKERAEAATRPIEKPVADVKPVEKAVALPVLPKIMTTEDSKTKTEVVSPDESTEQKPDPIIEKPVERKPMETRPEEKQKLVEKKVRPVVEQKAMPVVQPVEQKTTERQEEKQTERKPVEIKKEKKEEPERRKKQPKKKPTEPQSRQENRGDRGEQQYEQHKGDTEAKDRGPTSTSSKGASKKPEIGNAAETNYRGLVSRKLSRAKGRMPSPANGKLWVTFTILSDGSISGLSVTKSSGKPAVDATALKIVRTAAPFPPIPAEIGRKSWKMTVPMTFRGG